MTKKYLIVGVNRYYDNRFYTTEGAVNSAITWKYILDKKGFSGKILLNEFATADAILEEFDSLMTNLEEGDFACFIFIGHGGKWESGNDRDKKKNKLLYPFFSHIRNKDLREILNKNVKNVPVLILLDCCANGVDDEKLMLDESKNEIVISASETDEVMKLDTINFYRQTVFSHFAQTIVRENEDLDYERFIDLINEKISRSDYQQSPKLICTNPQLLKSPIFSSIIPDSRILNKDNVEDIGKNKNIGLGQIC